MDKIVKVIGSLAISLLIMLIPVLCTLAFVYNWNGTIKFLITMLTLMFCLILWAAIYDGANK